MPPEPENTNNCHYPRFPPPSVIIHLFKEAKQKTKRILLEKLGSESVEWGHKNPGTSGITY